MKIQSNKSPGISQIINIRGQLICETGGKPVRRE